MVDQWGVSNSLEWEKSINGRVRSIQILLIYLLFIVVFLVLNKNIWALKHFKDSIRQLNTQEITYKYT
jgi:hypothetical protein